MKKKMRSLLALMLAVAMLASFAGCSKEVDPKEEFVNGLKGTVAALSQVGGQFGYDEIAKMTMNSPIHQELELYLADADLGMDLSDFVGTGIYLTADSSVPDKQMDLDLLLRVADYDALNMDMIYTDDGVYIGSQELLGDKLLGFAMAELAEASGMDVAAMDPYAIMSKYMDENGKFQLAAETKAGLKAAWDTLAQASTFENPETQATITAGDNSGEADIYTMTIPAQAFIDFVAAVGKTVMMDEDVASLMETALVYELEYYDSYEAMIDEALTELQDNMAATLTEPVVLEYAVMDKLLRQLKTSINADGEVLDIALTFGMGKNVADYIDLTIEVDGGTIALTSTGNHVLSDGKFTDLTTLYVDAPDEPSLVDFTLETDYDTKGGDYTFTADIYVEDEGISLYSDGNLIIDGKTLDMAINDLSFEFMGMSAMLEGAYRISESQFVPVDVSGAVSLPNMTDDEYYELEALLSENSYVLLMDIAQNVPAVGALIGF